MFNRTIVSFLVVSGFLFAATVECLGDVAAQFKLAEQYSKNRRDYKQGESILKTIIAEHPNTSDALKAQRKLITLYLYQDKNTEAQADFNKMLTDYANNPNLAEEIYWVGRGYRVAEEFDKAESLYQMVIQRDPNSTWANRSRINIKNMEVWTLMKAEQFTQAKTLLEQMITVFSTDPYLPEALYWTARKFRQTNQFADASNLYQKIVHDYPNDPFTKKATLEMQNCFMQQVFNTGDNSRLMVEIDRVIEISPKDSNLASMISKLGSHCHDKAFDLRKAGNEQESLVYARHAASIFEKIVQKLPPSTDYTPEAMARAGNTYKMWGLYDKAIPWYEKVVRDWPNYHFAPQAQFEIAASYNLWKQAGGIPKDIAFEKELQGYSAVISRWPDSKFAEMARKWLVYYGK